MLSIPDLLKILLLLYDHLEDKTRKIVCRSRKTPKNINIQKLPKRGERDADSSKEYEMLEKTVV